MALPEHVDVLIVGAGPVGLTLAAELRRNDVAPLLLDRQTEGVNTSRAAIIHARTLEVLESLITEDLLREGLHVSNFRIRERDKEILTISFDEIHSKYQFAVMIPQNETEKILLNKLHALGGEVVRPAAFISLREEGESFLVTVDHDGSSTEIRAKYVVGCDGSRSLVREQLGIGFEGGSYEQSFLLGDVAMDWPYGTSEVSLYLSPEGLAIVAPLPHGRFRIVATMDDAPEHPAVADMQRLLDERGPQSQPAKVTDLSWGSRFHIHHRVAKAMRKGNAMIIGDAAHVHSPAGGQGMNTGIQDAMALGQALSSVFHGADSAVLDDWEKSRLEIAHRVVTFTDRMTRVGTAQSAVGRTLRDGAMALLGHIGPLRRAMAENLAELNNR